MTITTSISRKWTRPMAPEHCTVYTVGRATEESGLASVFGDDGLLDVIPALPEGSYWIAQGEFARGRAWVFSPREWHLECDGFEAGPGWIITEMAAPRPAPDAGSRSPMPYEEVIVDSLQRDAP